jgi:hypothetical protein
MLQIMLHGTAAGQWKPLEITELQLQHECNMTGTKN